MAGEYFGIRLDTDKLEQDAQQAKKAFDDIANEAVQTGKVIDRVYDQVNGTITETIKNANDSDEAIGKKLGQGAQAATAKFNALGFSIQQIARELPSLTLSPQMFFLAISNNIPTFTDALSQARKEYEAMTAAGQKGIPVWKQLTKSLFSWQTAISLIPTLLLVYGDDIVTFFEEILTGTKKLDLASETMNKFREAISKGVGNAQGEVTELKLLYDATQDVTISVENRKKAVDALQEKYPQYFANMKDEDILAGNAADSYDKLTKSIVASAKAKAMADLISENELKIYNTEVQLQEKRAQLEKERSEYFEKAKANEKNRNVFSALQLDAARNAMESTEEEIGNLINELYKLQKFSTDTQKRINVEDLIFDTKGDDKSGKTKAIDNLKQYLNDLLGLQEDNEERQIELTKTGTEKQIALIELRYNRQIEAVKKLQEDLKKAQGGKLTTEQQGIFGTALSGLQGMKQAETTSVKNKQLEDERKAMQDYLAEYGDYWEKRKAIAEKYDDEIAKATTKGRKLSLQAEMTEALAKLDDEAQKKTSIITQLFGNMATKSVDEMRKIADKAEQLLTFIEGGDYQKDNAFGITEEQFKVLSQSPEKLESIKNEIQNVRNEADKAEPTFERIKDLLQKIFSINGSEGNGGKNKLEDWLNDLNGEIGKVIQSVSFLSNAFSNLGDAFGSDALSGVAEGLNVAMDAVNSAMQGAQAGAMFGPIGAAAGAAVGVVTSLASSIAKIHDKKNEQQIQRLQEQIDTLSKSYDNLGNEIEKAYSKDASNLIEQQNKLLEQQKVLIQNQIKEEQDKKKTDEDRIKEWEQQIEEINELIDENKEKAVDAIFGEDVQSAIDRFSTAVTDMWANNTNASKSARDAVKQMMQQMVTESIKSLIKTSGKMEEIRQKMQEFYADEVFSGWEQDYIYNMADQLQQEINDKFGWSQGLFQDKTSTQQTATSKGFETMTQDQASELSGTFTALYESGLRQEQQINIGNVNLESIRSTAIETKDLVQSCYTELVEIRENTGAIVKPIIQMQKDMAEMKNDIKNKL